MRRNPELEHRLADHPDDRETWAVYADWLQGQGDPRGELIALELQHAKHKSDAKLGALVATVHHRVMTPLIAELEARVGVKLGCRFGLVDNVTLARYQLAAPMTDMLRDVLDHPLCFMSSLLLSDPPSDGAAEIAVLGARAPRSLRNLALEFRLDATSLEPLYALANLERLCFSDLYDGSPALRSLAAAPWRLRGLTFGVRAADETSDEIARLLGRDDQLDELVIEIVGKRDAEQKLASAITRALVDSPSAASLERLTLHGPLAPDDYNVIVKHVAKFKRLFEVHLPSQTFTQRLSDELAPMRDD